MAGGPSKPGTVIIPWYATGFRADAFEAALNEIAPVALRYGAELLRRLPRRATTATLPAARPLRATTSTGNATGKARR